MSNASDVALWALTKGDACPSVSRIEAALSAAPPSYAQNGDTLYPGVTLIDADNGLVHISVVDAKAPGHRFCVSPTQDSLDPKGKGHATIEYNTAFAAGADRGLGMWLRVMPVKPQDSAASPFVPDLQAGWLPDADSFGNEYDTWEKVIDHAVNHWQLPK